MEVQEYSHYKALILPRLFIRAFVVATIVVALLGISSPSYGAGVSRETPLRAVERKAKLKTVTRETPLRAVERKAKLKTVTRETPLRAVERKARNSNNALKIRFYSIFN